MMNSRRMTTAMTVMMMMAVMVLLRVFYHSPDRNPEYFCPPGVQPRPGHHEIGLNTTNIDAAWMRSVRIMESQRLRNGHDKSLAREENITRQNLCNRQSIPRTLTPEHQMTVLAEGSGKEETPHVLTPTTAGYFTGNRLRTRKATILSLPLPALPLPHPINPRCS